MHRSARRADPQTMPNRPAGAQRAPANEGLAGLQAAADSSAPVQRVAALQAAADGVIQRKTVAELGNYAQPAPQNVDSVRTDYATLTVGATHTGDMYQLMGAKALFPRLNVLLWGVTVSDNHTTVNSAYQIASYINDSQHTYYTAGGKPGNNKPSRQEYEGLTHGNAIGWNKWIDEGGSSSVILYATENSNNGGNTERAAMRTGTAPIGNAQEEQAFDQALTQHGFAANTPYIIVNFRRSGHNGGTAPALDTGTTGYADIIAEVTQRFNNATIVPMGEVLPANFPAQNANLHNYFLWPAVAGDRRKQAGLLRYLNENYNVIGAVGMRSGVMDGLALAGFKILSIDISPEKQGNTSKGWERGSKLERALGASYGRAFIKDERHNETNLQDNNWAGAFSATDKATIGSAADTFFANQQPAAGTKHPSHPLSVQSLNALLIRVSNRYMRDPGAQRDNTHPLDPADRRMINMLNTLLAKDYTAVPNAANYLNVFRNVLQ
ncbi:MAG: hypothetical protein AAFR40_10570 [Pseudomonadota bacterium]